MGGYTEGQAGDFNQAMMEIGACVCIPNGAPHCEECPLRQICLAYEDGTQQQYPNKAKAKERTIEEKTILIIRMRSLRCCTSDRLRACSPECMNSRQ